MAVTVDPAGSVLLVAPEHLTTDELDGIVTRKAEWIVRRLRRTESYGPLLSPHWRVVGRVMPDYERRREDLRRCGVGLAW